MPGFRLPGKPKENPVMASGTAKKTATRSRPSPTNGREGSPRLKESPAGRAVERPASGVASREEIRVMADALGRLADEGRLRILFLLDETSRNVAALGEALG